MQEKGQEIDFFEFLRTAPEQLNENLQVNLALRMKYPTQTDKFYQSEQQINETLTKFQQKLQQTQQSAYRVINEIVNSKFLLPLIKTLQHPNLDINISAINSFYSLTIQMDEDIDQAEKNQMQQRQKQGGNKKQQTSQDAFAIFFRMNIWFIQNGLLQSIFKIMNRIDQQNIEQYQACRKILKMLEYLIQLSDTVYPILIRQTTIITFLANRIMPNFKVSHRIIDDNKFIVSDILLALLQTPQIEQNLSAVRQFYKCFGIEVIIETASSYEKQLPTSVDQREYLMNLFGCLNVMLVSVRQSRQQFHSMKGTYLMISYICIKSQYAVAALKAISNALDGQAPVQDNIAICEQIVNDGSLKYIFPILMMQGLKGKDGEQQEQINQHILRIIYYLIRNSTGVIRDRVLHKITQKRYVRLQRIFQLRIENQTTEDINKQADIAPEEYIQLIKDQGLGVVEICDKIILTVWGIEHKAREKIVALLAVYAVGAADIRNVIQRHYRFIDEGNEKDYIANLIATNLRELEQAVGAEDKAKNGKSKQKQEHKQKDK